MPVDPSTALDRLGIDPDGVVVEEVSHNRWLTAGIWLVSTPERRMVLKCAAPPTDAPGTAWDRHWTMGSDDPRRWNFWEREALAYEHDLAGSFASSGIVAPALLGVERVDDQIALLLELADGTPAEHWSIDDYATAAAALGRAQGAFPAGRPLPGHPWLSRHFLRDYVAAKPVDWSQLDDDSAWEQPLVRRNFPAELREAAAWLHASRERLLAIAESLPRTLCHLDFWTKNLIGRDDGTVVLIDWGFAGDGAVGEDIGNLVPDAAFDHFVPAADLPQLEAAVLGAYVDGLADAGWSGDPLVVELGFCASAVKYDWLTPLMLATVSEARQLRYGGTEEVDADFKFAERGAALLRNVEVARRAIDLASTLGR